ncbi:tetratricopeptide (TPR) repeat protein [Anaerosolibacter carboniphilus]|uniref:Tetratricopeptide (TPR) repeat protein n=1 Tax=Anaerosolibacter carboniphilus TaxID=1417629 RepID=A0A841KNZ7_9FIRM|nr:hypothetical protein [Anaerosolibacter carboniphilus]MBB6215157.1 tetratricopeptide (TPR) repeat protein [Anaerosolibacter carboniphilus]
MENVTFPGEILKKIRRTLKFRQHEIVGGEITRNLVSIIENNKASLTRDTANILVANLNRLCRERNIDLILEIRDLFTAGRFEAKQKAAEYTQVLEEKLLTKEDMEKYLEEVNLFFGEWDLPDEKANIYGRVADHFDAKFDYEKSYLYHIKAFESAIRLSNPTIIVECLAKLMAVCIRTGRYKETIEYGNFANIYRQEVADKLFVRILYNGALADMYLSQYEIAIEKIQEIEGFIEEKQLTKYLDLMILKAICYKRDNNYEKAQDIYQDLIPQLKDGMVENKAMILTNMLEIYCLLGETSKVVTQIDELMPLLKQVEGKSLYLSQIKLEIGRAYHYLEKYDLAEKYLYEALEYGKRLQDYGSIKKSIDCLTDMQLSRDEHAAKLACIDRLKGEVLSLISNKMIDFHSKSILRIMTYYNNLNRSQELDDILRAFYQVKGDEGLYV